MGVRVVFCLRRQPSLTQEQFEEHWRDVHGALVRERAAALRVRRYEQSFPVPGDPAGPVARLRGAPEAYDGIASLWFDSVEDFYAAGATPEGRAAARELLDDERRFIDLERSPIWMVEDESVVAQ